MSEETRNTALPCQTTIYEQCGHIICICSCHNHHHCPSLRRLPPVYRGTCSPDCRHSIDMDIRWYEGSVSPTGRTTECDKHGIMHLDCDGVEVWSYEQAGTIGSFIFEYGPGARSKVSFIHVDGTNCDCIPVMSGGSSGYSASIEDNTEEELLRLLEEGRLGAYVGVNGEQRVVCMPGALDKTTTLSYVICPTRVEEEGSDGAGAGFKWCC